MGESSKNGAVDLRRPRKGMRGSSSIVAPRTWLLVGEKLGDNAQTRVVADALGWPYEEKQVVMLERWVLGKPMVRASIDHIDLAKSDPLEGPWPDLVIAIGRRLSSVALWIKKQSRGHTKIVLLGKPRRLIGHFDLVVAASQYRMGDRQNVLRHSLPLMRIDPASIEEETERWRDRLAEMARPLTAALIGGPTGTLRLDESTAEQLAGELRAIVDQSGGSIFVTTSRRTPEGVVDRLADGLPSGSRLFRWTPDAKENPYRALLGLADRFVVSSDSASMMIEVARLGRPMAIALLDEEPTLFGRLWQRVTARDEATRLASGARGLSTVLDGPLSLLGLGPPSRDLSAIPRQLVAQGSAVWLGEPFGEAVQETVDEVEMVAERVRALFSVQATAA